MSESDTASRNASRRPVPPNSACSQCLRTVHPMSIALRPTAKSTDLPHFLCQKVAEDVLICEDGGMTQQDKPAVVERVNVALIADSAAALGSSAPI